MGVPGFFSEFLPLFCPKSLLQDFQVTEAVVIADVSALGYRLGNGMPREFGHRLLKTVPEIKGTYVFVSDSDMPLPEKDLTRANRPRRESLPVSIVKLHDFTFELSDGTMMTDPIDAVDLMSRYRAPLFAYLKEFLARVVIPEATIVTRIFHDSDAPEADIAIAHRILEHKSSLYYVRTDDADVVAILVVRFRSELVLGLFNIIVDRGSKCSDRYVDLSEIARTLNRLDMSSDAFLGFCFCCGTDFVFKQWLSHKVGVKTLYARWLTHRKQFRHMNLRDMQQFASFVHIVTGSRVSLDKPVPMKLRRLETEVVPWKQIAFNFEYWYPQKPHAVPAPLLEPQLPVQEPPGLSLSSRSEPPPKASRFLFLKGIGDLTVLDSSDPQTAEPASSQLAPDAAPVAPLECPPSGREWRPTTSPPECAMTPPPSAEIAAESTVSETF